MDALAGNVARLFEKLIAVAVDQFAATIVCYRHMAGVGIAQAEALHEKLFDGYDAVQPMLGGKIGDAETALAQYALYLVFPVL